jgi:hypothetical protein
VPSAFNLSEGVDYDGMVWWARIPVAPMVIFFFIQTW